MSQAIIDFCEGLKTTLLNLEYRLDQAKSSLDASTTLVAKEAKKHVDDAADQLAAFKAKAAVIGQAVRAELPERAEVAKEKLKDFGLEAQVAMRHAAVLLAETASKGAEGAAEALHAGSKKAQTIAQNLRHETALTTADRQTSAQPPASSEPT